MTSEHDRANCNCDSDMACWAETARAHKAVIRDLRARIAELERMRIQDERSWAHTYHVLALATGHCGALLDQRCLGCAHLAGSSTDDE